MKVELKPADPDSKRARIFVVCSSQGQLESMQKIATTQGVLTVNVASLDSIRGIKVGRIDILPDATISPELASHCKMRRIQLFKWTHSQWNRFTMEERESKGGDLLDS